MTSRSSESGRLLKLWRQSGTNDNTGNADSHVTYASTNNPNQSGFYCSLPPGSRHAAKAQEICATMHSGRPAPKEAQPQILTQGSGPRRVIKSVSAQEEEEARDSRKGGWVGSHGQSQRQQVPERRSQRPASNQSQNEPLRDPQVVAPAPPVAYKYDNGQQVAYHSQNGNGELYVSAPKGTEEAVLFENVAYMLTSGGVSDIGLLLIAIKLIRYSRIGGFQTSSSKRRPNGRAG